METAVRATAHSRGPLARFVRGFRGLGMEFSSTTRDCRVRFVGGRFFFPGIASGVGVEGGGDPEAGRVVRGGSGNQ
jgi:hypothetical protein